MKAKTIQYERLVNTGNFSHEKYAVEIEIEKTDTVSEAFREAKKVIMHQIVGCSDVDREIAGRVREYDEDEEEFPF